MTPTHIIYAPVNGWLVMCARPKWYRKLWLYVTGRRFKTGWDVSPVEQPLPGSHGEYSCLLERHASARGVVELPSGGLAEQRAVSLFNFPGAQVQRTAGVGGFVEVR